MAPTERRMTDRLQVGIGLVSLSVLVAAIGYFIAVSATTIVGVRILILALFAVVIAGLWFVAIRNGRAEHDARDALREENPGALVERVRLWSLPKGRVLKDVPIHFLIADAVEIVFETINHTVLARIPVDELTFVDIVTAKGDRSLDKALTLIYGDEQHVVQLFTITYASTDKLRARLRAAIGWPADGVPDAAP
jgi:hypothetical protein